MSDSSEDFFALPAFAPEQALQQLRRWLREQRALSERGASFTLAGSEVLRLGVQGAVLEVQLAKRPAQSPEWELQRCTQAADVRRVKDEITRRLRRWSEDD
ncbi:hypothetical protein ACG0Z6_09830 [Roseateles sp. BYS180W]|uniref:Uncharacterized protein n=1 Tax=Roseateles rivi TaxID=3299028 RepID=A0ABW7FW50_9BURK